MSKRPILMFTLGALVLLGLVAGMFTGSIENALGTPQPTQTTANTAKMQQKPANNKKNNTPVATNPANNTQQNQPNQQNQQSQPNQQATVLAKDTFQRPNQTLWGTATDGRQWGGDANTKPPFTINGMKGQIAGGQGALEAVLGLKANDVDVTISGTVNQFGNNVNLGIVLRWTDTNNWYKAFIDGNQLIILKSMTGQAAPTTIARMDAKSNAGSAQTLRFRTLGTMLFAKTWPSGSTEPPNWMLVVDDHTFSTGQFGIRVFEQSTTVINIMSFNAIRAATNNGI